MSEEELLIEKNGYICTIIVNRPQRRNALNADVLTRLGDVLNSFKEAGDIRVVILRGTGEDAFSSGMDLASSKEGGERERRQGALPYARESIMACPCPVIAMVYGYAAGAGCDLAVTCDFRIAADNAKFAIPPVKLGLVYDYKAIQRFINLIGVGFTKELFLTGKYIDATRAKEIGLINYMLSKKDLPAFTTSFAQEIADNAPLAVASTKQAISKLLTYQRPLQQEEEEIKAMIEMSWKSQDAAEARKAFAEKRKPVFKGV